MLFIFKSNSLSKKTSRLLNNSTKINQRFRTLLQSSRSYILVIPAILVIIIIGYYYSKYISLTIPVVEFTISKDEAKVLIEKRIANIVTLFSISIIVLTFILNIAEKQKFGKKALSVMLEEIYFYPILYFALGTLGCLGILSYMPNYIYFTDKIFISLTKIGGIFFYLIFLFALGYLFFKISKLLNTDFLFQKRLNKINFLARKELYKEAENRLSTSLFMKELKPVIYITDFIFAEDKITDVSFHPGRIITDVNLRRLKKYLNKISNDRSDYYWSVRFGGIGDYSNNLNLSTNAHLSLDDIRNVKRCFSFSQLNSNDVSFENEMDAINDLTLKALENQNVKNAKKVFHFYNSLSETLFGEINIYNKKIEGNSNTWWAVTNQIFENLTKILEKIANGNYEDNFRDSIIDETLSVNAKLILKAINEKNHLFFNDHLFWLHNSVFYLKQKQLRYDYIALKVPEYYYVFHFVIADKFENENSIEGKKIINEKYFPLTFNALYRLTCFYLDEEKIDEFKYCISQIKKCELSEKTKKELLTLRKDIDELRERAETNQKEKLSNLQRRYQTLKFSADYSKSLLIIVYSIILKKDALKKIPVDTSSELLAKIENPYWEDSDASRPETLCEEWLWTDQNWTQLISQTWDHERINNGDIALYFVSRLLVSPSFLRTDQIATHGYIIEKYHGYINKWTGEFDKDFDFWNVILGFDNNELYNNRKNFLKDVVDCIIKKEVLYKKNKIRKAVIEESIVEKFKKNVLVGYRNSYWFDQIISIFSKHKQKYSLQNMDMFDHKITVHIEEPKENFFLEKEEELLSHNIGYSLGVPHGQELSKKVACYFARTILHELPFVEYNSFSSGIEKAIRELKEKGFEPDLIIVNMRPSEVFTKRTEKIGNTEFSWFTQKKPPFKHIALSEIAPFFIVCQFDTAFNVIQYFHQDWLDKELKVEIKDKNGRKRDELINSIKKPKYKYYANKVELSDINRNFDELLEHVCEQIDTLTNYYLNRDSEIEMKFLEQSQNLLIVSSINMKIEIKDQNAVILGKSAV